MATLVLTTLGGAIGGPVGAALGAVAGRALDGRVFGAGSPREGPRLTELRVQTSSYGTAIPRLFGTMRVAGTVIWSTDLVEHRSVGSAGKGQPGVARYSYSASFAVLLSARSVRSVGRVWADGQLLRGAAGDWKVATAFRLHLGGEDQAADPLIASAEGGQTPAYRGCAYGVFENLALESFGNRLPSLTFEVIADAGAVAVGAIAADLADEVDGAPGLVVDGFAASGGSVAAVLETLAMASGAWFAPVGIGLEMRDGGGPLRTIVPQQGREGSRDVAAADAAPATVSVRHYDPARDWQAGLQRARSSDGRGAALALDVPAAIDSAVAKGIAEAALARAELGRVRRTVPATLDALDLAPGDVVALSDDRGDWRIEEVALEGMATTLTLVPLARAPVAATASAGRMLAAPDLVAGATLLHAVELPALDDALNTQPQLAVIAAGEGTGWRGAPLLLSLDGGGSWTAVGGTAAAAIVGVTAAPLAAGDAALVDRAHALDVTLARADMMLGDADAGVLDAGGNLALVGDELLQFARAEPLGGAQWRLTGLWRGRRCTAASGAAMGDRFVLLTPDSVRMLALPLGSLGATVQVMAAGVGDGDLPVAVSAVVTGASLLPPAPVALRWTASGGGGEMRWTRRSRAGWRWLDRVDAPLGEEREAYRVTIASFGGLRTVEGDAAVVAILAAEHAAGAVTVTVRQRGTYGESAPAIMVVEGV